MASQTQLPRLRVPKHVMDLPKGKRIAWARNQRKVSQERLAEMTGLTRVHVNRIERLRHEPKRKTLDRISEALSLPEQLLADDEDEESEAMEALMTALRVLVRRAKDSS